ncbi:MAG: hypothetical protein ACIAXF_16215 [Phycisphaerales bacterium JB063]
MTPPPHPLELYRLSVQHPLAEVAFVERVWAHYRAVPANDGEMREPLLLREDFAGTCALAAAWVQSHPERQAMAIELDEPTAAWAAEAYQSCPHCAEDLHIVADDVMAVPEPATDVTLALNFSTLIYHDEASLLAYLRHARACLAEDGLLVLDLFGITPDQVPSEQSRAIDPDDATTPPFTYSWQQRRYAPATQRIDCRIHFTLADGSAMRDAFVYDWRLWDMPTMLRLMREASFAQAEAWGQAAMDGGGDDGPVDGRFSVLDPPPGEGDWVCYLVGVC